MSTWNEKHLPNIARVLLGLIFTIFGLNGFFNFMPAPEVPEPAGAFLGALAESGYMMPLIKSVEVVGGLLLLTGRYIPLALVLLVPNVVNILLFHVFLAPGGLAIALVLVVLEGYLAWSFRDVYAPLFKPSIRPTDQRSPEQRFSRHPAATAG